jgi:hypothetical protein
MFNSLGASIDYIKLNTEYTQNKEVDSFDDIL